MKDLHKDLDLQETITKSKIDSVNNLREVVKKMFIGLKLVFLSTMAMQNNIYLRRNEHMTTEQTQTETTIIFIIALLC